MQTFKERSKEMDYSNLYYPYADKGPKKVKRIQDLWAIVFSCFILWFGLKFWANNIKVQPLETSVDISTPVNTKDPILMITDLLSRFKINDFASNITSSGSAIVKSVLLGIASVLMFIMITITLINLILFINYLINVVKRNREFERQVFKNDMEAVSLYRKIQSSLKINKRLREAKKTIKPKSSGNSGDYQEPSADNLSKVEELKYMKKMDIRVNTRQKLASSKINTVYSIYMNLPLDDTTAQNLMKRIENLNETFTRIAKGKVTMGGYQLTEDRQTLVFQGETPDLVDPYDYSDKLASINKVEEVKEFYESAYKISNFVDRQSKIDEIKDQAEEWAQRTGAMLDRYLITAKMKVTRLDTNVSSSKATYTYDMALDSNLSSGFNKFDEQLDKAFKLRGSSVNIINGRMEIILPIPKEYHIPINVPTLYRAAFGDVKE